MAVLADAKASDAAGSRQGRSRRHGGDRGELVGTAAVRRGRLGRWQAGHGGAARRYDGEARRRTRLGGEHRPVGQHGGAVVGCYHGN